MYKLPTALLLVFAASTGPVAQSPATQAPAPQKPATQAPAPQNPAAQSPAAPRSTPRAAPATTSAPSTLSVQVTDKSGTGIASVAVAASGPVDRSGTTGADGATAFRNMRAGIYRLRFVHDGFITLEREVAMRGATDVSVALNPAPAKPVAAPPPAAPAPVVQPAERKLRPVEPRALSIPDFVEHNLISSQPQKTSLIACTDGGSARILQIKEPLRNQQNETADQLLYVVAGGGTVRVRDQAYKADPGSFVLIPRGVSHSIEREGRNPLIAMTVALGPQCNETAALAR
jgi:hypothetical protein